MKRPTLLPASTDGDLEALAAILAGMALVAAGLMVDSGPSDQTHEGDHASTTNAGRDLPPRLDQTTGKRRRVA
jgi:hypothetical protein